MISAANSTAPLRGTQPHLAIQQCFDALDVEAVHWFTLAAGTALAAASQVARVAFQLIVNRPPGPSIVPVIVSPSISPL